MFIESFKVGFYPVIILHFHDHIGCYYYIFINSNAS